MINFKLGDLVEKFLYITGIKWLWEKYKGGPCDECKKRKIYLNKLYDKHNTTRE
tara:strand:- start:186 stop:347 length:162 start_codon:yes stop_codon:yes gene_type:complete